jgi:hypothetical protein
VRRCAPKVSRGMTLDERNLHNKVRPLAIRRMVVWMVD